MTKQHLYRMVWILALLWLAPGLVQSESHAETPAHHTSQGFRNYPPIEPNAQLGFAFYWKRFIASLSQPEVPAHHVLPQHQALARYNALQDKNSISWIGQSTLIIKINGVVILTDPYFAKLASPLLVGPQRFVPPGIKPDEMPSVDIILLSHNHYDHLDEAFIEALPSKAHTQVIVPLGMAPFFSERGYRHVHELDWYGTISVSDITFTALPAVHYSGRGVADKNRTLWCAWAIASSAGHYYFLGGSAYSPTVFKATAEASPPFDLAILPIGTYGNRKYGVNNHTTPEEAVRIAKEIDAKVVMGIHWGTIDLSDEDPWEPPQRFFQAAQQGGYGDEDIWLLKIGETWQLPTPTQGEP